MVFGQRECVDSAAWSDYGESWELRVFPTTNFDQSNNEDDYDEKEEGYCDDSSKHSTVISIPLVLYSDRCAKNIYRF